MGTFLVSPRSGQKGTYLRQVRPLLLGNEECPHFPSLLFTVTDTRLC